MTGCIVACSLSGITFDCTHICGAGIFYFDDPEVEE